MSTTILQTFSSFFTANGITVSDAKKRNWCSYRTGYLYTNLVSSAYFAKASWSEL